MFCFWTITSYCGIIHKSGGLLRGFCCSGEKPLKLSVNIWQWAELSDWNIKLTRGESGGGGGAVRLLTVTVTWCILINVPQYHCSITTSHPAIQHWALDQLTNYHQVLDQERAAGGEIKMFPSSVLTLNKIIIIEGSLCFSLISILQIFATIYD